MAEQFERLKKQRHQDVIDTYYSLLIETEKHREKERLAAIAIQTNWRMLKVKWNFKSKVRACNHISRVFRGHRARLGVDHVGKNRNKQRQMAYYAQMATIVQKFYRGYYVRRWEHDFYARKKYLQYVETKNEEVRRNLDDHNKKIGQDEQKRQEQCARTEFAELASNLHHLTSTKAVPGVYNPPYSQLKPQAFNVDIETHLKSTFKSNYAWKPPSKEKINFFRTLAQEQKKASVQLGIATK